MALELRAESLSKLAFPEGAVRERIPSLRSTPFVPALARFTFSPSKDFRSRLKVQPLDEEERSAALPAQLPEQERQKVLILTTSARSFTRFRGELLDSAVALGHQVTVKSFTGTTGGPGEFEQQIKDRGGRWEELAIKPTGMNPLKDVIGLSRLVAQLQKEQPDSLILFGMKPIALGSIAGRLAGVKNIVSTIAGVGFAFTSQSMKGRIAGAALSTQLRPALAGNSKVIFQNQDDLEMFCERGLVKAEQCALVSGSGVDLNYYSPQPSQANDFRFLLPARLIHSKGIGEYVEAAQIVKRFYPEARFQLMGGGMENPDGIPAESVQSWLKQGLIEHLGQLDDVRAPLRDASVVVLPSYREGVSVALLEALAMGKPVITTDVPGCRDTVAHRENGLIVEPQSPVMLAQAMLHMINNRRLLPRMGSVSRSLAESYWDRQLVTQQMLSLSRLASAEGAASRVALST